MISVRGDDRILKVARSIAALAGNTWTLLCAATNASGVRTEVWGAVATSAKSSDKFTVNLSAPSQMAVAGKSYRGAASFGNTAPGTGTGIQPGARLTLQDTGNFLVGFLGFVCVSGDTIAAFSGTRERYVVPALNSVGFALIDCTQTAAGSLPVLGSLSASRAWAVAGVELRTGAAFGGCLDYPAGSATALTRLTQVGYIVTFNEPPFNASAPVATTGGGSGAAFF